MNTKEEFVREACVAKAAVDSGIDLNAYAFGVEYGYDSQSAEIKRLRDAIQHLASEVKYPEIALKYLKPQESEVSNG